jgi:hypothetical protein
MVTVKGFATQREGVEVRTRRIIRVKSLAAADYDTAGKAVPVIRAITGFRPPLGRGPGFRRAKPKTFETAEQLADVFGDAAAKRISEQVDFDDQFLLLFRWAGSGQDKLSFRINEQGETAKVVFKFRPGLTRDLRPHAYLYCIRKGVVFEIDQKNLSPRISARKRKPAVDPSAAADRILDGKKAQKLEVRHSMIGFRNTLLFYTFKDHQAILTLSIGNTDETFPVKGKVHLFDDATTEEGLKKWINNQHSDGLFPDVPMPIFTRELPEGSCKVTSHKHTGTSESPTSPETFKNYEVKLSVKECVIDKKVKLSTFTDTALVHVKSK